MPGILDRTRSERILPLELGGRHWVPLDVGGTLVLPLEWIRVYGDLPEVPQECEGSFGSFSG